MQGLDDAEDVVDFFSDEDDLTESEGEAEIELEVRQTKRDDDRKMSRFLYGSRSQQRCVRRWGNGWDSQGRLLGYNEFGVVRLYLQRDEHENIIDRIVMKDVFLDHDNWTAPHKWHGPPHEGVPMEVHCMQMIKDRPGSEFCAKIRKKPKVKLEELKYRLCMEYCPYNSLVKLLDVNPEHLPEPALWSIFSNLVDACLVLQYGGVAENEAKPAWTPIVHRDIHTGNVWLKDRSENNADFSKLPSCCSRRLRTGDHDRR